MTVLIALSKWAAVGMVIAYTASIPLGDRMWAQLVETLDEARSWAGQVSPHDPRFRLPAQADLSRLVPGRLGRRFTWWVPRLYIGFLRGASEPPPDRVR